MENYVTPNLEIGDLMFFDEIILSRKAWHFRLQSYIFGEPPFKENFCPYFWLTITCLLIVPFVFSVKTVIRLSGLVKALFEILFLPIDNFFRIMERNICTPYLEKKYRSFSPDKVYSLSYEVDNYTKEVQDHMRYVKEFENWKKAVGIGWPELLADIKEKIRKRKEKERKERSKLEAIRQSKTILKKQKRKVLLGKIATYTKWIVTPIVITLGIAISVAGIYYSICGMALLTKIIYGNYQVVLITLALVFGASLLLGFLFYFVPKLFKKISRCFVFLPTPKKVPYHDSFWFYNMLDRLLAPFGIFYDYLMVFKQNNCPAIKWKKEEDV